MKMPLEYALPRKDESLPHPYLVLITAIVLPGVGHLLLRMPQRALTFVFFVLSLGWITTHLAGPSAPLLMQYSGGIIVQGFAVLDAYRWARLRWEISRSS